MCSVSGADTDTTLFDCLHGVIDLRKIRGREENGENLEKFALRVPGDAISIVEVVEHLELGELERSF